ncbi:uncharacterized protein LOC124264666 isoform X2 [Haliotis rubra]|uniref:uncharacterized protein LOC124264666 isoform X2 n=1 Tax=Haliotis rubra TaxID=36100 RepID=UPI001EE594A6|nr:uncharacterized protein LOC124264666 isoform X2 [Haliotis rubra]
MKGAIAIVVFLAVSVPRCDGQQQCDYNSITACTNRLTQTVFPNLSNNTLVCRFYREYIQCVYGVAGCDGASIVADLTKQILGSNVDFNARCGAGLTTRMPPMPTTWAPPASGLTWTTRPSWGCNVYEINMCSSNLQMEHGRGMGCDAAANFVKCLNKLTACTGNTEFTNARNNFKAMGYEQQCPHVFQDHASSASTSTLSVMASLTFALMALFWI